ncbi:MAG: tRNA pseudouridine(38-40) synthase TruA [Bacteroidetes bacterium]|nr:MAG: tRNA pseudouridine(38-40) synthase TruA [Bacteroidota bacterium]
MSRYFIHMAYDGSNYCGWQVQPNELAVQRVLENALSTLLKREIAVIGAGRTDTGVHASYFIAHFDLDSTDTYLPASKQFLFKLNRFLPPDIVIYKITTVPDDMHACFSATYRSYQYHISSIKPLYKRNYSHYVYGELDVEAINSCCKVILATTDFTSFAKLHTNVKTNNCRVTNARWRNVDQGYLFEITADRFLRNMVRSLTGTLLDVGRGKLDIQGFKKIVEAKDRSKAGSSAPAKGLFLVDIGYPEIGNSD